MQNNDYRILNFGRSGIGLSDMYIIQKSQVEKFNPDIIIYLVSNGDLYRRHQDKLLPKIKLDSDKITIDYNFNRLAVNRFNRSKVMIQNSTLLNMTNLARKRFKEDYIELLFGKFGEYIKSKDKNIAIENKAQSEKREVPFKILEQLDAKKVIFVNRDELAMPRNFVDSIRKFGFKYYDLSPLLKEGINKKKNPFYWDVTDKLGHWNYKTHHILAKELIRIIEESGAK